MLSIFRSNQLTVGLLLIFYLLLLRAAVFIYPLPTLTEPYGVGSQWLWLLTKGNDLAISLSALLLVFFQAMLVVFLVFRHRLSPEMNLFSGVFVCWLGSLLPAFLPLSAYQVANVFLLFSLFSIMSTYKVNSAADSIFNTGFWIGMASLFQPNYLWFFLPGLAGLGILRANRIKEQVMMLLGISVPHLLAAFLSFWNNQWYRYVELQWTLPFSLPTLTPPSDGLGFWVRMTIMSIIVIVVLFNYGGYRHRTTIEVQKKIDLLYWYLLAGGLTVVTTADLNLQHWQVVVIPCGILLGISMTKLDNRTAEALHLLLLALLFVLQYLPMLR